MLSRQFGLLRRVTTLALAATALASPVFAQEKTITVASHYNADQAKPITDCFAQYMTEHPDIKIEYQQASYGDFLQTILTSRANGTSPDIYNIYSIWAPQLVRAGALATPPQDVVDWVKSSYAEGTVGAATIGGQIYGIPTELSVFMLVYNKKLLADAGFNAPPKTWAELEEMGKAITKKNDQGVITTAGYAFGPTISNAVHPFYAMLLANGVTPFNEDYTATNLKSPEAVKVLTDMVDLYNQGITSNTNVVGDFTAGTVGMAIMANWNKQGLQEGFGDAFADTVGVAPIPSDGDWKTMLYSFFWAVDSSSDVQQESWDLLKWLNTAQTEGGISCTGAMMQGMGALTGSTADTAAMGADLTDAFTAPYVAAVAEGRAVTQPNTMQESEIERILRSYIEQAWAGTMTPEEALTAADGEIQSILDE